MNRRGAARNGQVLVALAFACDLTRVISFQFNGSVGSWSLPDIGATKGDHRRRNRSLDQ